MSGWWSHDWIIYLNGLTDRECDWTFPPCLCSPPTGISQDRKLRTTERTLSVFDSSWVRPTQCSHEVKVQFLGGEMGEGQYTLKGNEVIISSFQWKNIYIFFHIPYLH